MPRADARPLTFEQWRKEVDRIVQVKTGLSLDDLPDVDTRSMYDDETHPRVAAARAIRNARE